jgi:CRP/FNR family cyclic AMP-dependent transcriptional regulator
MSAKSALLAEVPFFALLDADERGALAERLDEESFSAKSIIFRFGDPGEAMYIVITGSVELAFKNDTGEKIVLETARTGDFFGEVSMLDNGPRMATATVLEDATVLVVDRGDIDAFVRAHPAAALDLLTATGRRLRESARLLRHTASRNVNEEMEDTRSTVMRVADWIAAFSGSIPFLMIHVVIFFIWIILNAGPLASMRFGGFDRYPFGLLTMVVSLEAIILSVFVLLSQNRQVARERVRNDIEYDVNLKAEMQIAHMHVKVDDMHAELLSRLDKIEKLTRSANEAHPRQPSS